MQPDLNVVAEVAPSSPVNVAEKVGTPIFLGELLIQMGRIRQSDVESVLLYQRQNDCSFGRAALALNLVQESDITAALARQFHYPISQNADLLKTVSKEIVVAHEPFSPGAEAVRTIRTALLHKWLDKGNRSLAIIGAERQGGTTYLAANLAVAFAQMGLSTVLVDANMRQPRLAEIFAVNSRRPGLSDFLRGHETDYSALLSNILPSLSIILPGAAPPNPQELLSAREFLSLVAQLESHFEAVIYDTPSGLALADTLIICSRMGSALLVARSNKTSFANIKQISRIKETGCNIVGTVLNEY